MILTPEHPDRARYLAMKGSSPLKNLVRLDTETGHYEQVVDFGSGETEFKTVKGVADGVFFLGSGADEWVRIDG